MYVCRCASPGSLANFSTMVTLNHSKYLRGKTVAGVSRIGSEVKPLFCLSKVLGLIPNTLDTINTVKKIRQNGDQSVSHMTTHVVVCTSEEKPLFTVT